MSHKDVCSEVVLRRNPPAHWCAFGAVVLGLALAIGLFLFAGYPARAAVAGPPEATTPPRLDGGFEASADASGRAQDSLLQTSNPASPPAINATHTVCPAGFPTCDYGSIQAAVDAAGDGDLIKVATGTYTDLHVRPRTDITTTGVVTQVVYITKTVIISGGYTTSNWDTRDPEGNPTTLDAGGLGRGIYVSGDIAPTIAGLRVTYGDATGMGGWPNPFMGPWEEDAGGGIYVISATVEILDNRIMTNTASEGAGLIVVYSENANVRNNTVSGNAGGGGQIYGSSAGIWGNTFSNNEDTGLRLMFDYCSGEGPCYGSDVRGNTIRDNGNCGMDVFINSSTIDGNTIISNSTPHEGGGGLHLNHASGTLTNNLIAYNHAEHHGGGLYVWGKGDDYVPQAVHNTIVGNTAGDGTGIYVTSFPEELVVMTLANTIVASHTVGLYADDGSTVIVDGVLWYNTPMTVSHSLTSTVIVDHQHMGDPEFVWPAGGDYHIGPASAARDNGWWVERPPDLIWDIDRQPRRMGWAPDLGFDEYPDARLTLENNTSAQLVRGGDPLTYTHVITSDGVKNATGAVVTNTMDAWQRATGAWSTQGPCSVTDPNWGGEVVCTPGTMITGTSVLVTVTAEVAPGVPAAQAMTNTAAVTANETGWTDWAHTVTPGDLTYPLQTDPWTLDINLANDVPGRLVLAQLMEGLYRYGPDSSIEPAGALTHTISPDVQVYTFTLRADALWSDGQPVTAQHYWDGIIRLLDPHTGSDRAWMLYSIENAWEFNRGTITDPGLVGVSVLDPTTLEFTLRGPASHFPSLMATLASYPVRLDLIESDPDWTKAGHFVGNGPYLLGDWKQGSFLILEANPHYYGAGQVHFAPLLLPVLPDAGQLALYEDDLADVSLVPGSEVSRVLSDPVLGAEFHRTQARGVYYLGMNTQLTATDDLNVRQALASAIDRTAIISDVFNQPWTEPATSVIPPSIPGYQNGLVGYPLDPTQAQIYLAQAGYPGGSGFPGIELWANEGNEDRIEAVADQWRNHLNITVTTFYTDWQTYLGLLRDCQGDPGACSYGAYRMGWLMDYADAHNLLNDVFHPGGSNHFTGWDNAEYRQLIDLAASETDPALRTAYLQEADRILVEEEAAVIPVYFYDNAALIKGNVAYEYPPLYEPYLMKWREFAGPVVLTLDPLQTSTYLGQQFDVVVQVQAGEQPVDGAAAYLNFDPSILQVVGTTPGPELEVPIQNAFSNVTGEIDYAAGTFSAFPSGTFTLVTVTFQAIAETEGTTLEFNLTPPRQSDATYGGGSVLHHTEDGTVIISAKADLVGSVTLQGRPAPPDPRWSIPLTLELYPAGESSPLYEFTPTTDAHGVFTVTDILSDTYTALVKNLHTLQNRQVVTLTIGTNEVDFGTLREGDANNDNCVTLVDFSILVTTFAKGEGEPGFDARADFNQDGWVTLLDFSLLATNFAQCGDTLATSVVRERPTIGVPANDVFIVVEPPLSSVSVGETFTVTIQVQAGSQLVDGAQASLDFDRAYIQVQQMTGNTDVFPLPLWNTYDNVVGTLDYAAGTLSDLPSGTFDFLQVQFEAIALTAGTDLSFHFEQPRMTDVTHGGGSMLSGHTGGEVVVHEKYSIYLPLIVRSISTAE